MALLKTRATGVYKKLKCVLEGEMWKSGDNPPGAVVYNMPLAVKVPLTLPALNSTYGTEMAQDASTGGTPIGIHDGTDAVEWTGSAISGIQWDFASTTQANNGTKSVEFANGVLNDTAQFAKGSTQDLSSHVAISMAVYIASGWNGNDEFQIYGYLTGTSSEVGDRVDLSSYIDVAQFDEWQSVVIPLTDMGLDTSTIDALRIQLTGKTGQSPTIYFDDIQIEETGAPIPFTISPLEGENFWLEGIELVAIDAYDGRLADSPVPHLSYNKLLNQAQLANGMLSTLSLDGNVVAAGVTRDASDLFERQYKVVDMITDGTNSLVRLRREFGYPLLLKGAADENIGFTMQDDMTGFISLKAFGFGYYLPEAFQ